MVDLTFSRMQRSPSHCERMQRAPNHSTRSLEQITIHQGPRKGRGAMWQLSEQTSVSSLPYLPLFKPCSESSLLHMEAGLYLGVLPLQMFFSGDNILKFLQTSVGPHWCLSAFAHFSAASCPGQNICGSSSLLLAAIKG